MVAQSKGLYTARNYRTYVAPKRPWQVEAGEISATVTHREMRAEQNAFGKERGWYLGLDLSAGRGPWRLISVDARNHEGVRVRNYNADAEAIDGERHVDLEISAPNTVRVPPNREPVTIAVTYQRGSEIRTQEMDVDYRVLVGETLPIDPSNDARPNAEFAERNMGDPTIERLIRRARIFPRGTLSQEISRLKRWLHYSIETDFVIPPITEGEGPERDYSGFTGSNNLTPTETVRYGGMCQNWTALTAAYLARRGFEVWVALDPGHAWTIARDLDGMRVYVDFALPNVIPEASAGTTPLSQERVYYPPRSRTGD